MTAARNVAHVSTTTLARGQESDSVPADPFLHAAGRGDVIETVGIAVDCKAKDDPSARLAERRISIRSRLGRVLTGDQICASARTCPRLTGEHAENAEKMLLCDLRVLGG
jgi:hypothetical protein